MNCHQTLNSRWKPIGRALMRAPHARTQTPARDSQRTTRGLPKTAGQSGKDVRDRMTGGRMVRHEAPRRLSMFNPVDFPLM